MNRTLSLTTVVPPDRELHIHLPGDIPVGPADILVKVVSHQDASCRTLGNLLDSGFCGLWQDRTDIEDSVDFARTLRVTSWQRNP